MAKTPGEMNSLHSVRNVVLKRLSVQTLTRVAKLTLLIVLSENLNCDSVLLQFTGAFRPVGLQIPASSARNSEQTEVR